MNTMNFIKVTASVVYTQGYAKIVDFYFPKSWTLSQREQFVADKQEVERCEVFIYEADRLTFMRGLTENEYDELMHDYYQQQQELFLDHP
jgi:hypothetical protein